MKPQTSYSDDSFSDDDVDIVAELRKREQTQTEMTQMAKAHQEQQQVNTQRQYTQREPGAVSKDELYLITGKVSVLEGQLEQLRREQQKRIDEIKRSYEEKLMEKDHTLEERTTVIKDQQEYIQQLKDKDEFLTIDENPTRSGMGNKRRRLERTLTEGELTTETTIAKPGSTNTNSIESSRLRSTSVAAEPSTPSVYVVNQTSWYEDERSIFTEAISSYVIPGTYKSTLDYLADITSKFNYNYLEFHLIKGETSFKSAILKFLIEFDDKHRIDNLISKFLSIIFNYIEECLDEGNNYLLPVPFFLSLINFSLNYKPKAISDSLIELATKKIVKILKNYSNILTSEIDYFSLPDSKEIMSYFTNDDMMDYSFIEKPMHLKILEVFCALFSMDILNSLGSLASFKMQTFKNSKVIYAFWTNLPSTLFFNFFQILTPPNFTNIAIEILLNSTFDNGNFAYTFKKDRDGQNINSNLLRLLVKSIDTISIRKQFDIHSLNYSIGNNYASKLIDLISPKLDNFSSGNKIESFCARAHSCETYASILNNSNRNYSKDEQLYLCYKLKLLDLFENLLVLNESINYELTKDDLFEKICNLMNKEQQLIFEQPRSVNIELRIDLISKCLLLIKYLINDLNISIPMPSLISKQLIICLLRIGANNMRDFSWNFVWKARKSGYRRPLFNAPLEVNMLDKFGFWQVLNGERGNDKELIEQRIDLETELNNGIEFNYSKEIIETSKEMLSDIFGQESDVFLASINYDLDEDIQMLES
ncbi:hypothetical protein DAMA08_000830 [Martiniozyma asiatica (nom. inval.)]|nr:hypothetical protein DAMA08_000830 [Martiniozyma asiatica]